MAHLIFDNVYDFYKMPEDERKALIGRVFKEHNTLYFPVQLAEGEFNYGIQQGLIHVSPIWKHYKTHEKHFKIGVTSPDDLDIDLNFGPEHVHLRQEIILFLKGMAKKSVTYKGILLKIRDHFKAGELYA